MKQFLLFSLCMATFTVAFGQATATMPADIELCDSNNPGDEIEEFDLTIRIPEILGIQNPANYIVTFHNTGADAANGTNEFLNPSSYSNIANPQDVHVRVENVNNGDFDTTTFALLVSNIPEVVNPTPLEVCDNDNDGFADFDLTQKDAEITGGDPSLVVTYHETLIDAENNMFPLSSPYTNITSWMQFIYVRVTGSTNGCAVTLGMWLFVNEYLVANQPNNLFIDEGDGDGFAIFDLTVNDAIISDNALDPLVFYFESEADAQSLTNEIANPSAYQNITNPQSIYVAYQEPAFGCYDASQSFTIATDGPTPLTDGDNDGIPDVIEDLNNNGDLTDDNTDGDAFPNYLDDDDDGDGTRTADEDYNNNGSPTDDDTNNNRIPDYLDEEVVLAVETISAEVISVYPNPTQNNVHIQWNDVTSVKAIAVYSLDGKLITAETISDATNTKEINLSATAAGIYFIKISTENGTLTEKIIKN